MNADLPETDPSATPRAPQIIGVVGTGTMGSGIAQLALEAGHEVVVHDVDEAAVERGRKLVRDGLVRRAAKVLDHPAGIDAWVADHLDRLRSTEVLEQLGDEADVVVEAALESLPLKQTIFKVLDGVAAPGTILATNTSSLPIGAIAAETQRPERVVGLHFFNPAPVMKLVEVVAGSRTDAIVLEAVADLVRGLGRVPVFSTDAPGFIVNRVNRPFTLRALRLLEAGLASIDQIDAAIRDAGFLLGPFELMDLTGIDVTHTASTAIWERLGRPDRLRPSPLQEARIEAGRLGRKTGEGFHRYEDGRRVDPVAGPVPVPHRSLARATLPADAIRDRILLAIVDEAYRARAEGVASEADIDLALRLGAAHPVGPFERARDIGGAAAVAARLRELARDDPSFAPSESISGD